MRNTSEIIINGKTLEERLKLHKLWFYGEEGGEKLLLPTNTDLSYVDLSCVNLIEVDLEGADLRGANLKGANLKGANLKNIRYNYKTSFYALQCPEEGSFIGFKKADDKIVKLLITEDAKRSSATNRICRCNKAKILNITNIENTEEFEQVSSDVDSSFIYKVGEIVEVKDFYEDRWLDSAMGIHFFITRAEAVNWY